MTREEARQYYNNTELGWIREGNFSNKAENIIDVVLYLNEQGRLDEMMPEVEGRSGFLTMLSQVIVNLNNEMPRIKDMEKFITYVRERAKESYPKYVGIPNDCALTAFDISRELRKIIRNDKDEQL